MAYGEAREILIEAEKSGAPGLANDKALWNRAVVLAEFSDNLKAVIRESVMGTIRTPAFRAKLSEIVTECATEIAREIVSEDLPELEQRVRDVVKLKWEEKVTAAAHELLQSKLDEIKRRL